MTAIWNFISHHPHISAACAVVLAWMVVTAWCCFVVGKRADERAEEMRRRFEKK